MEDKIDLIKSKLTGDKEQDIAYLNAIIENQNEVVQDALQTIDAVNTVLEGLAYEEVEEETNEKETTAEPEVEEENPQKKEIDDLINELSEHLDNGNTDEALLSIEKIIPKIENISKSDSDDVLYCSFSNEFEKLIFEKIFAGEKEVVDTPYANDVIYKLYANILIEKNRKKAAMDALERAIYWNFLNRDARSKKIDLLFDKKEYVKCLDAIKKLQNISYTAQDLANCYNKYAFVFESLKDSKSAYAVYRLSYSYFENPDVLNVINKYEEQHPEFKEMTDDEIYKLIQDNKVDIGPNSKIINAHRDITKELIEEGAITEAKTMIENDYAMTGEEEIAKIYNRLTELEKNMIEQAEEEKSKERATRKASTKKETDEKRLLKREQQRKK